MKRIFLDTRGLLCPLPVIRVQDRVQELEPGTLVEAVGSDPGILNDIPAWCRINGHRLIQASARGDEFLVVLEVGESND